jgi:hypothetical protein
MVISYFSIVYDINESYATVYLNIYLYMVVDCL